MNVDDINIDDEIRHEIPEFQTLLSFNRDDQNFAFQEWWGKIGKADFIRWYNMENGDNSRQLNRLERFSLKEQIQDYSLFGGFGV